MKQLSICACNQPEFFWTASSTLNHRMSAPWSGPVELEMNLASLWYYDLIVIVVVITAYISFSTWVFFSSLFIFCCCCYFCSSISIDVCFICCVCMLFVQAKRHFYVCNHCALSEYTFQCMCVCVARRVHFYRWISCMIFFFITRYYFVMCEEGLSLLLVYLWYSFHCVDSIVLSTFYCVAVYGPHWMNATRAGFLLFLLRLTIIFSSFNLFGLVQRK